MPTAFTWAVTVDGADIAPIALDGATIEYGRHSPMDQPAVPVAVVRLLTRDAYPGAAEDYPEFGLGDWASDLSGFVDAYTDTYSGVTSRIVAGVPVVIGANTPSGFTDAYEDPYTAGVNFTRFTGRVQAIDYDPGTIQLTCTPKSEAWSRIDVGGTAAGVTIPSETESARALRLAAEAGVTLVVDGAGTMEVLAILENTVPTPLMNQLVALMNGTGGLVYTDRANQVHVRTRAYPAPTTVTTLPPDTTMLDALRMTMDLGLVRNRIAVLYGTATAGAKRPRVTVTDAASITRYGPRDFVFPSPLVNQDDATALANQLLALLSPQWAMPGAEVALALADDATAAAVCALEQGSKVLLPQLLPGSPAPSHQSEVLGYTETLSHTDWRIGFHLSPQLASTIS